MNKTLEDMAKEKEEKLTFGVNEDTKGIELYDFISKNMKFEEVIRLYELLDMRTNKPYGIIYNGEIKTDN